MATSRLARCPVVPLSMLLVPLLSAASGTAGETLADRAFAQLRESPPVSPECFDFVVVGDTRSTKPIVLPETFKQSIREWNTLRPAFVIDVGDLILGGGAEGVPAQWDEFERVAATCRVPLFPVTGNHDISDAATERFWLDRVGPLCYAFTYGNSRFIALNSEEVGVLHGLSDEQVAWLKQDLEQTDAKHVFLFLHKPFFLDNWDRDWAPVAQVLDGHPVRAVFGADWHMYRDCGTRNGVRYVISAGGGAELRVPEDEGGFHHYCLVRVRGDEVTWSVVRPGAIQPEGCVTQARVKEVQDARAEWVGTEVLEAPMGEGVSRKVSVFVENPYDADFESTLAWAVPPGWTVTPAERSYVAKAGSVTSLDFQVEAAGPARFPVPELTTTFTGARYGGPIPVTRRLDLVHVYTIPRAPATVTPDGALDEWPEACGLPLPYGWEFDVEDKADLDATCLLMWDERNLYLAMEVEDDEFHQPYAGDIVWSADGIQLFMGKDKEWEWGLTRTESGPEVFLYKGVDREGETTSTVVPLGIRQEGRKTVYEAVFPRTELPVPELRAGSAFMFSIVANDLDPSRPKRPRHWAELTPGVGDAIPGSPMAKIVLAE